MACDLGPPVSKKHTLKAKGEPSKEASLSARTWELSTPSDIDFGRKQVRTGENLGWLWAQTWSGASRPAPQGDSRKTPDVLGPSLRDFCPHSPEPSTQVNLDFGRNIRRTVEKSHRARVPKKGQPLSARSSRKHPANS